MNEQSSDLERERNRIQQQYSAAAVAAVSVLLAGAVFYHLVEHFSWLDAFYFCTITLTTIGYGDITPHTTAGKLFTMFYALIGIGIIGFFANLLIKNASIKREMRRENRKKVRT
jgi:voltage-gated potassium channel